MIPPSGLWHAAPGLQKAISWCKENGLTKVYLEEFRDGYQADRATLLKAKAQFAQAGFLTSGCITPTQVGKSSTGWKNVISCYTDATTQAKVRTMFEFAAGLFDEIMIDDFWFTDCACAECDSARQEKKVRVGADSFPVSGNTWEDYRSELMVQISRRLVLTAAKKVNPKVQLIIKFPQWYDRFHERGYDVLRETTDFDQIWVGTESRDYQDPKWGGTPAFESYFIMRWLGGIGGAKCGGGWYDWLGTTEQTYLEQARQTVLGGAKESMLFCYGGLLGTTGPKNLEAFRRQYRELLEVAVEVQARKPVGLAAYKPANSPPGTEARIFDFIGMLGFPLVPCHEFPTNASAAFFSVHALKDSNLLVKLEKFVSAGKPVLMTDGLANALRESAWMKAANVYTLAVKGDPKTLLAMPLTELNSLRAPLLKPFGVRFDAPAQVGLYLYADGSVVVENFRSEVASVQLNDRPMTVGARAWSYEWK